VPDEVLDDLHRRLAATRWPDAELVDDWSQGAPLAYVQEVAAYWRDAYDWRARETALNRFDQYLVAVDGLDIHTVHVRSPHADALPLVITHGWPGSIVEFHKIIEPLTNPTAFGGDAADAFHVICPSLPGYGFSSRPRETGWGVDRIADTWDRLMGVLGYDRYGAQGGDWGAMVTTAIGQRHLGRCAAIHLNMPIALPDPATMGELTPAEQSALAGLQHYEAWDSGYSKQQSTRPQTLGYGLTDSPAGQLAWILEKFWSWTDCDGHPEHVLTRDEMLDNVMLYWVPAAATSSARLYWESFRSPNLDRVECPTGVAAFPKEILRTSRRWAERRFNVVHWTDMPKGGHFAAFEQPELLVGDLRTYFRAFR
jgi:pimeloyl-ACP methyl ester carboxylesterase